ncbi:MAG: pyridoxal-phosphate dependent enzyme, partial [Anaerolineales bacterium]
MYPDEGAPFRCQVCGGVFDYKTPLIFDRLSLDDTKPGIWKYQHTFKGFQNCEPVSLNEGNTPLQWIDFSGLKIGMKCEYLNPTRSYKDRGSTLLATFLKSRGVQKCIEDSSGNAGASLAAYSKKAGISLTVFIPSYASNTKKKLIRKHGAQLRTIEGTRSDVSNETLKAAASGISYASHAYLPFNLPGYASIAYELIEQMGGESPETIIIPVGQGGLLLGIFRGFQALQDANLINRIPKLVGVQARACAPLWSFYNGGIDGLRFASDNPTIAEGVRVWHPVRGDDVLKAVGSTGGIFVAVDEDEISDSLEELEYRGFMVEPTSAIVWSALVQLKDSLKDSTVLVLTGARK